MKKQNPKGPPPVNLKYAEIFLTRDIEIEKILDGCKIVDDKGGL